MRFLAAATALLLPFAASAQTPPPGTAVERITLHPGESASFTLAPGKDHQLLNRVDAGTPGAITIRYGVTNGMSTVVATSGIGYDTSFTVLADPDGDGGFEPAGDLALPGNGRPASRGWPKLLGTINVGDFTGGPHGTRDHTPSGE
jgi:hypothetical protein